MSFNYNTSQFAPPGSSIPNDFQKARFDQNYGSPAPNPNVATSVFPNNTANPAFSSANSGFSQPQSAFTNSAFASIPNSAPSSAFGALPNANFPQPNFSTNSTNLGTNFGANTASLGDSAAFSNSSALSGANFGTNFGPNSGVNFNTDSGVSNFHNTPFAANSSEFGANGNFGANNPSFSRSSGLPSNSLPSNSAFSSDQPKPKRREKKREKELKKEKDLKKSHESVNTKSFDPHTTPLSVPAFPKVAFPPAKHRVSHDLSILKPLPAPVTRCDFRAPDPWDVENQLHMKNIEQKYLQSQISLQTAYDKLTAMHKTERTEMEKRGLVDSVTSRRELSDAIQFTGTCIEMCPVYERVRRAHENDVLQLEKNARGQADQALAIKSFTRSSAGQLAPLPSDVRPPPVLVATLEYIVGQLVPKLPQSHAFIWDRTRSIRQDFTYQNYQGAEAIWCCEVIARIHCRSLHTMAYWGRTTGLDWSQQQEIEQFDKCLQSLMEFNQLLPSPNQPEMCAYLMLLHLDRPKVLATVDYMSPAISRHPLILLAMELRQLAKTATPEFFSRVRCSDVPPTFRCVAELHFNALRKQVVRDLALSVHRQRNMYPFPRFQRMLGFESREETLEFCDFFDLQISKSDAGEEVDLLTWSEANVRDKQTFKPAADESLNALLEQQDLLAALGPPIDVTQISSCDSDKAQGQNSFVPPIKAPSVAAPIPAPVPVASAPPLAVKSSAVANESLPAPPLDAEKAARLAEIKKEEARLQQIQAVNEARKQRLLEQKRQAQQQREQEKQQKLIDEQRRQAEERQREQKRQLMAQRQLHEQRQKQRESQRAVFISQVSKNILRELVQAEENNVQIVVQSIARHDRDLLKRVCHRIAQTAHKAYESQLSAQTRAEEMRLFRSKRQRVVSQRRARPNSYDMSFGSSIQNAAVESPSTPPTTVVETKPVDKMDPTLLADLLKPAYVQGLRRLVVIGDTDDTNEWLHLVLPFHEPLTVFPDEFCELSDKLPAHHSRDTAVLSSHPVASPVVSTTFSTSSLAALTTAIQKLVNEYVARQQDELASLRSLKPKRRRTVSGYHPPPINQDRDSLLSFGSETSMRRESLADAEQRLRRAIAHAKELSSTI